MRARFLAVAAAILTTSTAAAVVASPAAGAVPTMSDVRVRATGLHQVRVSWHNPAGARFEGVTIRRKAGAPPTSITSGHLVARLGPRHSRFTDRGLTKGTTYGYSVFARVKGFARHPVVTRRVVTRSDTLGTDGVLAAGHALWSPGNAYHAVMQTDGNFVVYGGAAPLWSSNTAGSGSADNLVMQSDGNLVVYGSGGAVWSSGTHGSQRDRLVMQSDGNLVIVSDYGQVWAIRPRTTLTAGAVLGTAGSLWSADGRYRATMQEDGNFVVYGPSGAIWASHTSGSQNWAVMQTDGNFVVYSASGQALWASNTGGSGSNNRLVMQTDSNLVVYTAANAPVWASNNSSARGIIGDDYPANLKNAAQDSVIDPWRFYNRECTSFVAWRLNSQNHVAFTDYYRGPQWGNANNWGPTARSLNIAVNNTPAPGAVAWSNAGTYGHVAWVADVRSDGSIDIEQYNAGYNGTYSSAHVPASSFTGYIHIADLS